MANITRDNTKFINGAIVGQRDVFQVSFRLLFSSFTFKFISLASVLSSEC